MKYPNQELTLSQIRKQHKLHDGKKARLDYPPLWATIGITGNCGFRCQYCCSHNKNVKNQNAINHFYKLPYNISLNDFNRILNMCWEGNVPHLHICGIGEPFIHQNVLQILDLTIERYGHTSTQTDFWKPLFTKKNYVKEIISRGNSIDFITTDIFPSSIHEIIKIGSDFQYLINCMEQISKESPIQFCLHVIVTKKSYMELSKLPQIIARRGIRASIKLVHLFPFGFNDFTDPQNIYTSDDLLIKKEMEATYHAAKDYGIPCNELLPWEHMNNNVSQCLILWQKIQFMPSKKVPQEKWNCNAIPQQCPAALFGDLFTLGNLLEYNSFMDFWNNPILVNLRQKVIDGQLPDTHCNKCMIGQHGHFIPHSRDSIITRFLRRAKKNCRIGNSI